MLASPDEYRLPNIPNPISVATARTVGGHPVGAGEDHRRVRFLVSTFDQEGADPEPCRTLVPRAEGERRTPGSSRGQFR